MAACYKQISLDSILQNRACAPISLQDFRTYLTLIERSIENLEFYEWYTQYSLNYHDNVNNNEDIQHALLTFFDPNSLLELNLDQKLKLKLLADLQYSTKPELFIPVVKQVMDNLANQSFPNFMQYSIRNIGPSSRAKRLCFSITMYLMVITWSSVVLMKGLSYLFMLLNFPFLFLGWISALNYWFGFCLLYNRFHYHDQPQPSDNIRSLSKDANFKAKFQLWYNNPTNISYKRIKIINPVLDALKQRIRIKMLIIALGMAFVNNLFLLFLALVIY